MSDRPPRRVGPMPVRVYPLGDEPGDDLSASSTPEERLAMVWELTMRAWALAGQPIPGYNRREMPVVVRRPG